MKISEFEDRLSKLTVHDLYNIHDKIYIETHGEAPLLTTGASKSHHIKSFTRWARGNSERVNLVLKKVDEKLSDKLAYPVRGPVPHTRYITWEEISNLPSFPHIVEAIEFRYDPASGPKHNPRTKDGYLSVYSIYNMSAWASWKSSSLSDYERHKAEAIQDLRLGTLMSLNKGRRMDQPALFPAGLLT